MVIRLEWKKQGSPEWLSMRRSHIMASDAPIIMEVSPYKSIEKLWEQKLTGSTDYVSPAMKKGTELEPVARAMYIKETGIEVVPDVVFHPDIDWMGASLDGISYDGSKVVEIKYTNKWHTLAEAGEVPDIYYPQLQHQLAVTGLDELDYCSFNGENIVIITVKRDEEYIKKLIQQENEFFHCLVNTIRPVSKHYNKVDDIEWDIMSDEWKKIKTKLKYLTEKENAIRKEMIDYCQGKNLIGNGVKISRTECKGKINYKDIPEISDVDLEDYRSDSTERFTINEVTLY